MSATHDVWTDPELRELVRAEPELVAVADALAQAGAGAVTAGPRRRLARRSRLVAVVAALAAAVAVALVAPWNRPGGGSLSDLALAAVGSQPVLHVIAETPTGAQLIDIQTGAAQPVNSEQEIWYDADRGLKRSVTRVGSTILDELLETPQGGYTRNGIVYDCAWIAAHPIEATRAGVSCSASGDNGSTPRVVPRPKPTLDPGLAGFVDGYRQALAAGLAREAGTGRLDGKTVDWLVFRTSDGSEKVALDRSTHKPLLLKSDSGWSLRIKTIETLPRTGVDFGRPTAGGAPVQPSHGGTTDEQAVPLDGASIGAAVPGALWAGARLGGLSLVKAERESLRTSFADGSSPLTGRGLELAYGTLGTNGRLDRSQPHVQLLEAPSRELAFGYMWGFVRGDAPARGKIYATIVNRGHERAYGEDGQPLPPAPPLALGFAVVDGMYVTIQASTTDLVLQAARSLHASAP